MLAFLNFIIAFIDIGLLLYVLNYQRTADAKGQWRALFLCALLCGMAYDNLVVATGQWFIGEPWFYTASMARFYSHVLILPFLSLFTWSVIRDFGVELGQKKAFFWLCSAVTVGSLLFGVSQELVGLQLVETSQFGISRMKDAHASVPMATILTNLFTIVMAGYIWRKTGWKVLFLSAAFIFIVNGGSAGQDWAFIAGGLAEILFVLGLILTHSHLSATTVVQRQQAIA